MVSSKKVLLWIDVVVKHFPNEQKTNKMSYNQTKIYSSWSKNWSGRGLAILDRMELGNERKRHSYSKTENESWLSYKKRLGYLCGRFPDNKFYQSLTAQLQIHKVLSTKQVRCIDSDFRKFFKKELNIV